MDATGDSLHVFFVGTGAADWAQPYCPAGEDAPGASRGYASVVLDGRVLIDCGSTVPDALQHFGVDVRGITDVLLTHAHGDHCDVDAIRCLVSLKGGVPLDLWAHPSVLAELPETDSIRCHAVDVGEVFELSSMSVTALAANHDVGDSTALHFLLQKPKACVLYATDGAWLLKDTWGHLRQMKLDTVIWDATCGETSGDGRIFEHNSIDMIRVMRQTLVKQGVLSPDSQLFLTHMARTLCASHEDMTRELAPEGLIPAYDGLAVTICRDAAE